MRPSRRSVDARGIRVRRLLRPLHTASFASERGSASLEFLTVGIILLVPLVYLVLAVASVQAGAMGVEGAARQAARVVVTAADQAASDVAVDRAVRVALADYGIDPAAASVDVSCDRADCIEPGARVSVSVVALVKLPLVPDVLSLTTIGCWPR